MSFNFLLVLLNLIYSKCTSGIRVYESETCDAYGWRCYQVLLWSFILLLLQALNILEAIDCFYLIETFRSIVIF
jgi:hypothetical protein